jgi:RimJ/RimL family protein N-acetyltransferase
VNIVVNEQWRLTEIRPSDKAALVRHLREREIYEQTLRIPYTEADADVWFEIVAATTARQRRPVQFAIRAAADELIGSCGFDGFEMGKAHLAEIGYWLAKPYWGRGIMTAVIGAACQHAFAEFGLVKVTAHVFATNPASARVLEKCGFEQEGYLRRHYRKDGQYLDALAYGLLR